MARSSLVTLRVNPNFKDVLLKYGSPKTITTCFNCGNCTAICSLTSETASFPRRLIRYAQLGLEGKLMSQPDAWLCYYCGECSDSCPREAEPGEMTMAIRRYLISRYSGPLARALYTSRLASGLFMGLTSLFALLLILFLHGPVDFTAVKLFEFLPYFAIEVVGIALGIVVAIVALFGIVRLGININRGIKELSGSDASVLKWVKEFFVTVFGEAIAQLRYFKCRRTGVGAKRHMMVHTIPHLATVIGFLGLFIITGLRFMMFPTHGEVVPITEPVRLAGIATGILLVYGSFTILINRIFKIDKSDSFSTYIDYAFPLLLFLAGLTGFLVNIFHYINSPLWSYVILSLHLIVAFELIVIAPFTKFVHSLYRPMALWVARVHGHV